MTKTVTVAIVADMPDALDWTHPWIRPSSFVIRYLTLIVDA